MNEIKEKGGKEKKGGDENQISDIIIQEEKFKKEEIEENYENNEE